MKERVTLSLWERVGPQGRGEGLQSCEICALQRALTTEIATPHPALRATLSLWERVPHAVRYFATSAPIFS